MICNTIFILQFFHTIADQIHDALLNCIISYSIIGNNDCYDQTFFYGELSIPNFGCGLLSSIRKKLIPTGVVAQLQPGEPIRVSKSIILLMVVAKLG